MRDDLDLDAAVERQLAGLDGRAGGLVRGEGGLVDGVHLLEVAHVLEVDGGLGDVLLATNIIEAGLDVPGIYQDVLLALQPEGGLKADAARAAAEETNVACARLAGSEVPDLLWPQFSRRLRREAAVRLAYALALRRAGQEDAAQDLLAQLLRDDWGAAAIEAFGQYAGSDAQRQLAQAEGWGVAEEALRRSQAMLLRAQEIARMGSWSQDLRTGAFTGGGGEGAWCVHALYYCI